MHHDDHNAIDFPTGTLDHAAQYTNEQTGLDEGLMKVAIAGGTIYVGYKLVKAVAKLLNNI